jgi:CHASE2 domain-containing sensor protein
MTSHTHASQGAPPRFLRRLLRALPVILIVSILTLLADRLHLLDSFHFLAMDLFVASAAAPESRTVIVDISDADFHDPQLFNGRSPLDPAMLQSIIAAVAAAKPAVIGVDVTTEERGDASLRTAFAGSSVPIVWARDAEPPDTATRPSDWRLGDVLGAAPAPDVRFGVAVFPRDSDRFVRGYYRRVPGVRLPTLAWAILDVYCSAPNRPECGRVRERLARGDGDDEIVRFNFAADRNTFPKIGASAVAAAPAGTFAGHPVIVGGTFAAGRDFYATPLGDMAGVELTARAIESELTGGGLGGVNDVLMFAFDILSGIALVYLNWRWQPGSRLNALVTTTAIAVLAMLGSYVAFRAFSYWATFVPVGIGVWLHECYDRAREAGDVRRELDAIRSERARP